MPAGPGETHLTTLYADVHYYFSDPAAIPAHHRFDRGSYLYLFHNTSEGRGKLEIANHAGTPNQAVVTGYLDTVRIVYSYKQPGLFSLTIDGPVSKPQWSMPGFDIGNEYKKSFDVHTLDIYLWTEKDAATLLEHIKSVVPERRLDIRHAPTATQHRDSMSPLVQQLEHTAVGNSFQARAGSTVSTSSFPGPPTPATSGGADVSPPTSPPQNMPYNPAAPAAPEHIQHREKTPPPPDDGSSTGLADVGRYDNRLPMQYSSVPSLGNNAVHNTQRQGYFPGPPGLQQGQLVQAAHAASSPADLSRTNTNSYSALQGNGPAGVPLQPQQSLSFAPPPVSPPPTQASYHQQPAPGYFNSVQQHQAPHMQTHHQNSMSFGPTAVPSPGLSTIPPPPTTSSPPTYASHNQQQSQSQSPQQQASTIQPHAAQQQIFSYSNYSYTDPVAQGTSSYVAGGAYTGNVHAQVYRPTEAEALHGHHGHGHGHVQQPAPNANPGVTGKVRLEAKVDQVEKRVGGFLKKLDKMW